MGVRDARTARQTVRPGLLEFAKRTSSIAAPVSEEEADRTELTSKAGEPMPAFTPAELEAATDVDLDHALARLYRLHRDAGLGDRAEWHAGIMQVLGEQAARRDAWMVQCG